MRPRCGPWPPMNMANGMRPPMRGRGGGPCGPMRGMGPRPPPFPGMGPPIRHFGPPMGPRGPHNRAGPMMPRMRPPLPHMMPPMMRPQRPMRPPIKKLNKMVQNEGKMKKKKLKFRSFYVTRPWVNDELRAEIAKKDSLFDQAKSSNKADDWAAFKEQKDKCVHMYSALKLEFIGQHPEEDVGKIMAELNSNKKPQLDSTMHNAEAKVGEVKKPEGATPAAETTA